MVLAAVSQALGPSAACISSRGGILRKSLQAQPHVRKHAVRASAKKDDESQNASDRTQQSKKSIAVRIRDDARWSQQIL